MSNNIDSISSSSPQVDAAKIAELDASLRDSLIRASHRYDAPKGIIWVNDTCIATLGNFSVTTGKAKSRKTFNVSAIAAAALSNSKVLSYRATLPEGKRGILYIDTEQSQFHCHKVYNRILTMAGMPTDVDQPNLIFEGLRGKSPTKLRELVERALERDKDKIGLVIIDGIRDLMLDINNSEESILLVTDLMRWSADYDIHIHVALHLNKSDDNVRGHIGTEINNKAETVLLVAKDRYDNNMSEVSPLYIRDKEFKPFHFQIDENGIPEDVYGYKLPLKEKKPVVSFSDLTDEQHTKALDEAFKHGVIVGRNKTFTALKNGYATIDFVRGLTTFNKILDHLIDKGTVIKKEKNTFYLSRDFPAKGNDEAANNQSKIENKE